MNKKYGVYICTGCGIGEALDIEKLSAVPKGEGVGIVKTHPFLCGKDGLELLKKETAGDGVNVLVIGACSRRVNFDVFKFDGCIVDRVNLREQVVWTHQSAKKAGEEGGIDHLQMMAEDYLKMGVKGAEDYSARTL